MKQSSVSADAKDFGEKVAPSSEISSFALSLFEQAQSVCLEEKKKGLKFPKKCNTALNNFGNFSQYFN